MARRGYRFIAPVGPVAEVSFDTAPAPPAVEPAALFPPAPAAPSRRSGRVRILTLSIASLLLMVAVAWGTRRLAFVRPSLSDVRETRTVQLAVLPLKVMTSGDTEKYLGVGIADAVTTQLANVRTLTLRPTAAVIKYEAGALDPRHAGEELDAEHVLSGTLQKSADTYRISMQLIRTADGLPIWGHSYLVARTDLLTIEEQVSQQVADALRVQLRAAGPGRPRMAPKDSAAYESYLQGRALVANYSEAKMRAAIESFERAVQLEPEYALARAGLATALAWFSVRYAYQKDAVYWGKRAEEEAYRALTLDHDLAEAHLAIANAAGTVYGHFNWPRLLAEVDGALQLDPTLDLGYASRARGLYHLGLFDAAGAAASKAIALNPEGNVETHRLFVALSLFDSHFADAAVRAEDLVSRSDAPVIRMYLGEALFYLGKRKEAAELLASVRRGTEPDVRSQAVLAAVLAATGRPAAAQAIVDTLQGSTSMDHHVAYSLGTAFAQLGRPGDAVTWLRSAADDGFPCYPWFAADPLLEPIRRDAGYRQLMADLRTRFETARTRYNR
jgi:TolB-like protein